MTLVLLLGATKHPKPLILNTLWFHLGHPGSHFGDPGEVHSATYSTAAAAPRRNVDLPKGRMPKEVGDESMSSARSES